MKKAVYAFWTTTMEANMMNVTDWRKETAGPAAPSTDQGRTAFTWPALTESFDGGNESEAESGKYIFSFSCRNKNLVQFSFERKGL